MLLLLPGSAFAASASEGRHPVQLALFGPDDPCDDLRDKLKDSDDFFNRDIINALVAGGVAGAIGGALGGGWKGAVIGGGVAAATSGLLAYYNQRAQEAAGNREMLAQSIGNDARAYGGQMDRATAAFLALKQCRLNQAAQIKADLASGKISRSEAQERLDFAKKRFREELAIAEHLGAQMNRHQEEMQAASDQLIQSDPEARSYFEGGPPPPSAGGPPPGPPPGSSGPPGPSGGEMTVEIARNGIVREGPASYTNKIVTLERGDTVIVLPGGQGDWVPIRLVDGRTGYVNKQAFKPGAVAAAAAAPPPRSQPAPPPPRQNRKEQLANAPPASRATVETAEVTRSNVKRRETYGNEVKTAQNDSQVAFNMN